VASEKPGFFEELKRRHVWRVAVTYAVAGWLIVQIATQVFPFFGIPNWGVRLVVILIAIGFPLAVILAWVYEITPEGVRRTEPAGSPAARPEQETRQIGRKLNSVIVAVLIVAVALMGWRLLVLRRAPPLQAVAKPALAIASGATKASIAAAPAFNPPAASIVVLPFKNLSGDPKQAYFSNGITEELTDALGQNTGLSVIAWQTASRFGNGQQTPEAIGKALNVAQVLGGSIQHEGDAVRVSAELVSTVTGRQLWSEHYDDSTQNIFAVQDKITAAIAGALRVKFAGLQAAPTLNPQAHELYLKGLAALDRQTAADAQAALEDFQAALKLDPNYADAWAGLAGAYQGLSQLSTLPLPEAQPKIRAAAGKALALDPHNVNALVQLGNADFRDNRIAQAKAEYQQALALDPNNARAHLDYGNVLPLKQALAETQEAARLDPDNAAAQNNLSVYAQDAGDWPQDLATSQAMSKLSPHDIDAAFYLAFAYTEMQRGEDAVKAFELVQPATALDKQLVDAGRLTYQALLQPALRPKALAALDALHRAHISPFSQGDLLQLYLALGEKATAMQMLPGICAAGPVGCSDLAINPQYTPLRGDPRFEKLSKRYTTVTLGAAPAAATSP
jgi:serine/threonine-protein kinase